MDSISCTAVLLVLAVAGLGNPAAVNSDLRKLNNRINKRINSMQQTMQQNINIMQMNIADLEFENRELRKELEGEKNRTSELEEKMNSALSRGSPAITDNGSRESTVQEEIQKIGDVINLLTNDVEQLKLRSDKSTDKLKVSIRKAFKIEKAKIRKLNETLETLKMAQNERLPTVHNCGIHKEIPNGDVSGDSFVGGTPVISCDSGYSQTGSAQCKVPVFWETDVKCQKDCAILHVANGVVIPDTSVPHGTTVTVTCDSGYEVAGTNTAVCNNGDFTGVPSCRPLSTGDILNIGSVPRQDVEVQGCAALHVANGMVTPSSSVLHGTAVTVKCDRGYEVVGNNNAFCNNGVYTEVPSCIRRIPPLSGCAALHVANGRVYPSSSVLHGTAVIVSCDSAYEVVGNYKAFCNNGVFTEVLSCVRRGSHLTDMIVDSNSIFRVELDGWISGVEFLADGRLAVCNYNSVNMKFLRSDFTLLDSLTLPSRPWDVSAVNTRTIIITLPKSQQLQYVHVLPRFRLSSNIQLDDTCYGIDVVGDEVFTSCDKGPRQGEIIVLDMAGIPKRRLGAQHGILFSAPGYLTVNPNTGYIYVSSWNTKNVTCFSSAGDIKNQYDIYWWSGPRDLYVDNDGNLFICGGHYHYFHVIPAGGKEDKILLTSSDGLEDPVSVAYRESDATFVTGGYGGNLFVFKLENYIRSLK